MNQRRRFLSVLGASIVTAGTQALTGCEDDSSTSTPSNSGGSGGSNNTGATGGSNAGTSGSSQGGSAGQSGSSGTSQGGSAGTNTGGSSGAGGNGATAGNGGSGGSATGGTSTGGTGGSCNPPNTIAVGAPSDYPNPGLHKVPGTSVLIGRDGSGLYARSALCTHNNCNMNQTVGGNSLGSETANGGILCKCHNSSFDSDGQRISGPANSPLKALRLELGCDGVLYADPSVVVTRDERVDA